ncbi:MAG: AzlD domain-containing protein [Lachnospiraceae bacterium]
MNNFWLYLLIMFGVTYAIRVLPFVAFRKKIKNRFFRSFLMYVPYTVLGAMTFPAVFYATGSLVTSMAGVAIALVLAYREKSLFEVAIFASLMAFVVSMVVSV